MGNSYINELIKLKDIRYHSFSKHLKDTFGSPVYKISIDAGFTCPNRDGYKGKGGCLYCNEKGSGASYIKRGLSVKEQILSGIEQMKKRKNAHKFIAYFQAFSNTYAPISHLRKLYDEALSIDGVVGLSVGTRPDIITDETLDLLEKYSKKTYFWIEYGLQSIHDRTLKLINRCHNYQGFEDTFIKTKKRKIKICVHVIIGLPGENREDILQTAEKLSELKPEGVKIHSLYISKGSPIEPLYNKGELKLFEVNEYISIAADYLERLPQETV
ncbi:MAG: TIGR01212 family radical SAM protein, partial [Candidatus Helarchaeota archaeon]|nr:TIGR01212 family radical SAM protein [Candidatus Helarchaeota archaeon]